MAQAADSSSLSIPTSENNLQSFFVLHRASPPCKPTAKARRRIDLSPKPSGSSFEEYKTRLETFKKFWSTTESIIKDVLKNINGNVFGEIDKWVHLSFEDIRARQRLDSGHATCPYSVLHNSSLDASGVSRQIFTALVLTKNIEFVDDIQTFVELGAHLRSHGCSVANLTSLDFSPKNGIGGCIKSLLKQFLALSIDAPDMSVLASWYIEQVNNEKPLVVIIDDVERCCGSVLVDFIIMMREWLIKVPIILILGMASTVDALRNSLSNKACSYLAVREFTLGTPSERMDAVVEAVLLKNCESFSIGKQVSTFLRNYFLRHDGTLTLFIRALRIAMAQHVYEEPLSSILRKLVNQEGSKGFDDDDLRETVLKCALDLPSFQRYCANSSKNTDWVSGLSELRKLHQLWCSVVMCLYEVGKFRKTKLLDLYCQMLELKLDSCHASNHTQAARDGTVSAHYNQLLGCLQNDSDILACQTVRDLSVVELSKLLNRWEIITRGTLEIHEKVKELQLQTKCDENLPMHDPREVSRMIRSRKHAHARVDKTPVNEKVAMFLQGVVRQYIRPIETLPFNEILFFDNADKLERALIGDPRRRIQTDLLESTKFLKCSCCRKSVGEPVPSMHDTSIMYSLAQEHGDLINLNEWYHSFKAIVCQPPVHANKKKLKLSPSPSPKKRKQSNEAQNKSDATIQAEFCRAVMELQITGLLRMPSKRRPDFVQRVAFGL